MLKTEQRNPKSANIDKASTREMLSIMQDENENAMKAVRSALGSIEKAVDVAAEKIKAGGRIIYVGAGTSGRLGILDAAECPPTFGVSPETFVHTTTRTSPPSTAQRPSCNPLGTKHPRRCMLHRAVHNSPVPISTAASTNRLVLKARRVATPTTAATIKRCKTSISKKSKFFTNTPCRDALQHVSTKPKTGADDESAPVFLLLIHVILRFQKVSGQESVVLSVGWWAAGELVAPRQVVEAPVVPWRVVLR